MKLIKNLSSIFGIKTGVSDHSLSPYIVPLLSLYCGATMLEKHITLSRKTIGLDDPVALEPKQFEQMVSKVRYAEKILQEIANLENQELQDIRIEEYLTDAADGILADLGVSSYQLDNKDRGFSYREDAVLDMRMDQTSPISAKTVVNTYSVQELSYIISTYGEEKYAKSIASNIVKYRENKEIETTGELIDIIRSSMPAKSLRENFLLVCVRDWVWQWHLQEILI